MRLRRRGRLFRPGRLAMLLVVVLLATALPAGSFTTGVLPREAGSDVVTDLGGTLGLDVAASVQKNQVSRLVTVTNNLGVTVSVTVTVTNSNKHDLSLGGVSQGTQTTFSLGAGSSQQVDVDAHPRETLVVFDVGASATGVSVNANGRSAQVV